LLEHFLALSARRHNVVRRRLTADLLRRLEAYDWPGNVRELRFAAERATLLAGDERLSLEDFPFLLVRPVEDGSDNFNLDTLEKQAVGRALLHFNGNITLAAEALGITRPALYRRIDKHGL
jgi:transcriptional regulator of acetoin/glycerol metabolism